MYSYNGQQVLDLSVTHLPASNTDVCHFEMAESAAQDMLSVPVSDLRLVYSRQRAATSRGGPSPISLQE